MPLSPLCLVNTGTSFVSTANGVDVSPSVTVSIKLAQPAGVTTWLLQVVGTDELSTVPVLSGVDNSSWVVTSPSTVVTLTYPAHQGSAIGLKSEVQGVGGPVITTFGLFGLTALGTRVGFVSETREGNSAFGWAAKINPLLRSGAGGGNAADGFGWKTIPEDKTVTVPQYREMIVSDPITVEGTLEVEGDVLVLALTGSGQQGDPGPAGPAVVDAPYNKHMPALTTTGAGRELACATGLTATPHPIGALYISVNGVWVTDIGYGSTTNCACYWSSDGGATAKARANVAINDRLYWNGLVADFDLDATTDFLDFWYDVAV